MGNRNQAGICVAMLVAGFLGAASAQAFTGLQLMGVTGGGAVSGGGGLKPGDLVESGIASWYGPGFEGRSTANCETFRTKSSWPLRGSKVYTAAHKTLPFDTILRVVSTATGKEVLVRINDRGPYVPGRIIDLNLAAMTQLGLVGAGHGHVRLFLVQMGTSYSCPAHR